MKSGYERRRSATKTSTAKTTFREVSRSVSKKRGRSARRGEMPQDESASPSQRVIDLDGLEYNELVLELEEADAEKAKAKDAARERRVI